MLFYNFSTTKQNAVHIICLILMEKGEHKQILFYAGFNR